MRIRAAARGGTRKGGERTRTVVCLLSELDPIKGNVTITFHEKYRNNICVYTLSTSQCMKQNDT